MAAPTSLLSLLCCPSLDVCPAGCLCSAARGRAGCPGLTFPFHSGNTEIKKGGKGMLLRSAISATRCFVLCN